MKQLGLLIRLIIGIIAGILIGMCGQWFGIADTAFFVTIIRLLATFTSLFSTFLSFMIPLIILSFITVGMAELGKKANRLFGLTLLLAYGTTVISGLLTFFIGKAVLPGLIQPITGDVLESNAFEPLFTITVDPIFGVMTALVFAFVLGIGMANLKGDSLLNVFRDLQKIVTGVLSRIIIPLIPIHIAGLFANIAAEGRLAATVKMFASLYAIIIVLQLLYILSQFGLASIVCRKNHFKSMKNVAPAYFTALGTQSSASTIPIALNCAYNNNINSDVADFVVPLCATINLNGDTICLVLGSMGIMLASGMIPTFACLLRLYSCWRYHGCGSGCTRRRRYVGTRPDLLDARLHRPDAAAYHCPALLAGQLRHCYQRHRRPGDCPHRGQGRPFCFRKITEKLFS